MFKIAKQKSCPKVKTAGKAFKLLEILGEKQPVYPPKLVQQLKLTRSNVDHLLSTLEETVYVDRSEGPSWKRRID